MMRAHPRWMAMKMALPRSILELNEVKIYIYLLKAVKRSWHHFSRREMVGIGIRICS